MSRAGKWEMRKVRRNESKKNKIKKHERRKRNWHMSKFMTGCQEAFHVYMYAGITACMRLFRLLFMFESELPALFLFLPALEAEIYVSGPACVYLLVTVGRTS